MDTFTMNSHIECEQFDVKHEDPLSIIEIKTESQDFECEVKTEEEECDDDVDVKQEILPREIVASIYTIYKVEDTKEVLDKSLQDSEVKMQQDQDKNVEDDTIVPSVRELKENYQTNGCVCDLQDKSDICCVQRFPRNGVYKEVPSGRMERGPLGVRWSGKNNWKMFPSGGSRQNSPDIRGPNSAIYRGLAGETH